MGSVIIFIFRLPVRMDNRLPPHQHRVSNMISKPTITNTALTSSAVVYSYAIPAGTRRLEIKLRALNALLYVGFDSALATYFTVPYGDNFRIDAKMGGSNIYLKSDQNTQTAEITVWK